MSAILIEQTLKYVNEARTNPRGFARHVQEEIDSFVDSRSMPLYPGCMYSTNEGKGAWVEAKEFLETVKPVPAYKIHHALNLTAKDHAVDMAKNGVQGHRGSNGSTLTDRIDYRCEDFDGGAWAENIGSTFNIAGRNHALKTVLGLIIDDGVSSRGHRENIFSTEYKFIGIYSVVQNDYIKTVMNFHSEDLVVDNDDNDEKNEPNPHFKKDEPQPQPQPQPQPHFQPYSQPNPQSNWGKWGWPQAQESGWGQPHFQHFEWNSNNGEFPKGKFPSGFNFSKEWDNFGVSPNHFYEYEFQSSEMPAVHVPKADSSPADPSRAGQKPKKPKKVVIGNQIRTNTIIENGIAKTVKIETIRYSDGSCQQITTPL